MTLGLPFPQQDHSTSTASSTEDDLDGSDSGLDHDDDGNGGTNGIDGGRGNDGRFTPSDVYCLDASTDDYGFAINDHFEPPAPKPEEPDRVAELEDRVERLSAVCEAMWHLVSDEVGLDLDRLTAKVAEFELNGAPAIDGEIDDARTCPNCGNHKPVTSKLCLFCSAKSPIDDVGH